jgi:hypothetical protein
MAAPPKKLMPPATVGDSAGPRTAVASSSNTANPEFDTSLADSPSGESLAVNPSRHRHADPAAVFPDGCYALVKHGRLRQHRETVALSTRYRRPAFFLHTDQHPPAPRLVAIPPRPSHRALRTCTICHAH